ncbi:MAG: ArsR family transcriptional regulator [Acidobacteria bacterium]|nr:MAG: ArsR family transcriptional regulator [Acidobacteriota bacterium]
MEPQGYESAQLDATFAALADPTRRAMLARLASGEATVTELAQPFAISQPAISKHLKVLERAGLITRSRDAQRRPRRIDARPLGEAVDWLERYRALWEDNFQRLDALLEELQESTRKSRRPPNTVQGEDPWRKSPLSSGSTARSKTPSTSTRQSSRKHTSRRSRP